MNKYVYLCTVYCLKASMSRCMYVCMNVPVWVCGLPEVSVLAVHGHTGTIWTWTDGEKQEERGEGKHRETQRGEKGIKRECE